MYINNLFFSLNKKKLEKSYKLIKSKTEIRIKIFLKNLSTNNYKEKLNTKIPLLWLKKF